MNPSRNDETDAVPPARPSPWLVVAVTTAVQGLVTMCTVIPVSIAPKLAEALDVPTALIGLQVSLIYMGATVMSPFGGHFARRFGAVRTSQLALALAGGGIVLVAAAALPVLALGSVLMGFAYGLTNPAGSYLLMRVTGSGNRNLIFSIKQTSVPLGGVVAGLAAPSLALMLGWQSAMLAGAGVTLAFMALCQSLRRAWDTDRDPSARMGGSFFSDAGLIWRSPVLGRLSLAAFCFSAVQVSLTTFVVTMLVEEIHVGLIEAGIVLAVLQVAGVTGRLVWGAAADALADGNRVLMIVGVLSAAGGILTTVFGATTPMAVVYGVMILFGISAVGWNGVFMAEVARLAPPGRIAAATGGALVPTFGGVLVGPATFAGVFALTGAYTASFGIFALVSLLGFGLALSARRRGGNP